MSKIEWTERTWNPIAGCSKVSAGCKNCYAETMAKRLVNIPTTQKKYNGTITNGHWSGVVNFDEKALIEPFRRKKPTMYFVNSMSDLFHENVPFEWVDKIMAVIALCQQHTFQVLTKRPERMKEYFDRVKNQKIKAFFGDNENMQGFIRDKSTGIKTCTIGFYNPIKNMVIISNNIENWKYIHLPQTEIFNRHFYNKEYTETFIIKQFPLPNLWLGVSVENQSEADKRIPTLLETPAKIRFLSCEPLLGLIDLQNIYHKGKSNKIDWVIVGGESGANARPMHPDWVRSLRDQFQDAGIAFFFKQWGGKTPKEKGDFLDGKQYHQFPL